MMPTLSSLVAPPVVIMTTDGATSYDKVSIMTARIFQCTVIVILYFYYTMFNLWQVCIMTTASFQCTAIVTLYFNDAMFNS